MYLTTNFQTLSEGIDNPNDYCIVEKNILCWFVTKIADAIWDTAMTTNGNKQKAVELLDHLPYLFLPRPGISSCLRKLLPIAITNMSWCILKNRSLIGICIGPKP